MCKNSATKDGTIREEYQKAQTKMIPFQKSAKGLIRYNMGLNGRAKKCPFQTFGHNSFKFVSLVSILSEKFSYDICNTMAFV